MVAVTRSCARILVVTAGDARTSDADPWLTLHRLHPAPAREVDAAEAYAWPPVPWLRANMVSSVDGAATLHGRVGTLTGPADQRLLLLLRALADVLVVGAGTVRAEGYGPLTVDAALAPLRRAAGLSPAPRLVVPTGSLDLDLRGPAFAGALEPPLVFVTATTPPRRVEAAREVAEVVILGEHAVDLTAMVDHLHGRGYHRILSEGGPTLLARLFAHDLVDELCLAVSPIVVGGIATRVTSGTSVVPPRRLALRQVAEREEFLFLRHARET